MSAGLMFALAFAPLGCVTGPGGSPAVTSPDLEQFVAEVQPVFASSCANATCHGDPARPLEIYAVHNHRLDPDDVYLDADLSEDELWLNYVGARTFIDELRWLDGADADDSALLTKPLDPAAGGAEHTGGVQFFDAGERDYAIIRAWIADALQEDS